MKKNSSGARERLIRVIAVRRGAPVELRVHYECANQKGCNIYRLLAVEETD
jgi:hypothetical protein